MYKRLCSGCNKELVYKTKSNFERSEAAKSQCRQCTNTRINKSTSRKGSENPAWAGYEDVPGKVFSRIVNGAKNRNIEVTITIEDIHAQYIRQNKRCAFTDIPLEFGLDASVDRKDSKAGYHTWNIQIVHKTLNMMKKDMPNDMFIAWCKMVK
jgi:hypothetical protein